MIENWQIINNFENYTISNSGNVKNNKNKILKPKLQNGYLRISLRNTNIRKTFRIHRLVAEHFIPNTENKPTVNHKNKIKTDNQITNLEWATHNEQNKHKNQNRDNSKNHLISARAVWQCDINTNKKLQYFKSIDLASQWIVKNKFTTAKITNNVISSICAVCRQKNHTAYGFKWYYNNDIIKLPNEIWKNLTCIDEPAWKISNYGRIINKTGKLTKPVYHPSGYPQITIKKKYAIHRLVAKTFILNPDNKPQVNHIDGNKNNYHTSNLQWVTQTENNLHAKRNGLDSTIRAVEQYTQDNKIITTFANCAEAAEKTGTSINTIQRAVNKNLEKQIINNEGLQVQQIDKNGHIINTFKSGREASLKTNLSYGGINRCCLGRPASKTAKNNQKFCGGYQWQYIGEKYKWRYIN